ncbi:Matrix-remodeling-associated protein 7 [Frankliniella fusca]|uniref:Matrix-remodeling-associated protein 7 n=1 Tax=Frankliniella fusca TaxID=407009 RepID=A0AAE1GV50_9NEOP|nr:Matrix-remodeling-associated protein 7 [Frankliniella fusca]
MADTSSNWENLCTFYLHLSPIYVCSSLFTCLALFWTWWSSQKTSGDNKPSFQATKYQGTTAKSSRHKDKLNFNSSFKYPADDSVNESEEEANECNEKPSVMKHLKSARQQVIEKQLAAGLSKEQLEKEKETQASQLEAIYKLLKEKEDQFNIRSMDELQEQLKLYK